MISLAMYCATIASSLPVDVRLLLSAGLANEYNPGLPRLPQLFTNSRVHRRKHKAGTAGDKRIVCAVVRQFPNDQYM